MGEIILIITIVLLTVVSTSIFVLLEDMPYYKKVYDSLPKKDFSRSGNQIYADNRKVIWFLNNNTFGLDTSKLVYLHNAFYTFLNPYSAYWYFKYKNWFMKNVDPNKIRKITLDDL